MYDPIPEESDVSRLDQDVRVAGFDVLTLAMPPAPGKKFKTIGEKRTNVQRVCLLTFYTVP